MERSADGGGEESGMKVMVGCGRRGVVGGLSIGGKKRYRNKEIGEHKEFMATCCVWWT